MQIVREIENFQPTDAPLYLALGNFDGVHQGHKKLIGELAEQAHRVGGLAAAFIFEPHPAKILAPEKAPKLLVSPEQKAELLEKLGLDVLILNSFTREISYWVPEEFVERILVEKLKAKEVYVGFNYTFGHKGLGTPELLTELGKRDNFKVNIIPPVKVNGEVVSSSLIRQALEKGNIQRASHMLGYNPVVEGQVIEGEHRGSTIGFPTANLAISSEIQIPGKGVYAAQAVLGGKKYSCVVNIGSKPTFHQDFPLAVEVHLLDFSQQIYGRRLKIWFLQKLRDEKKFSGIDELVSQIRIDSNRARDISSR